MKKNFREGIIWLSSGKIYYIINITCMAITLMLAFFANDFFTFIIPLIPLSLINAIHDTNKETIQKNKILLICLASYFTWEFLFYLLLIVTLLFFKSLVSNWLSTLILILFFVFLLTFVSSKIANFFKKKLK